MTTASMTAAPTTMNGSSTLGEQLAAAAAASRVATLGELFVHGAGTVQVDIQSFLRQLAASPQAATEAEKERQRREKRRLRKRKRELMAANVMSSSPAAGKDASDGQHKPKAKTQKRAKATTTKSESGKKPRTPKSASRREAVAAGATATFPPCPPAPTPVSTAPVPIGAYPSAPTSPQPWSAVEPSLLARHQSLPLLCADAQCNCGGLAHAAMQPQGPCSWQAFAQHDSTAAYHCPTASPGASVLLEAPLSPLISSSSSSLSSPAFSLQPPPLLPHATPRPPVLSWVDSFFSSLGEMTDLLEESGSGFSCVTGGTTTTASSSTACSMAASLRHLYPSGLDWPAGGFMAGGGADSFDSADAAAAASYYYNQRHQRPHDALPTLHPPRSPITDLLYSTTTSSVSASPALLPSSSSSSSANSHWPADGWSSSSPHPHTAGACPCCPPPPQPQPGTAVLHYPIPSTRNLWPAWA